MTAVKALTDRLGQFLSPYLASALMLLLRSDLLESSAAAADLAAAARTSLTRSVPARLLLPAMIQHFSAALKVPTCLLEQAKPAFDV